MPQLYTASTVQGRNAKGRDHGKATFSTIKGALYHHIAAMIVSGSIPRDQPPYEKTIIRKSFSPTSGEIIHFPGWMDESGLTSESPIDAGPSLSGDLWLRTSPMAQRDTEHPSGKKDRRVIIVKRKGILAG